MFNLNVRRALLKISGEALKGPNGEGVGFDYNFCLKIAHHIKELHDQGMQIAIVVGAGNYFRGAHSSKMSIERTSADSVGMLATMMNGLILKNIFSSVGCDCKVMSALQCLDVAEYYTADRASDYLESGKVVILTGGTGNPFFTTDTAASLRASELKAEILLKATKVDGIYDSDPVSNTNAKKYESLTYSKVLAEKLQVMDLTAITMCMENNIPIFVFNIFSEDGIVNQLSSHQGTIVIGE